jgi:hypothetical protein
MWLELRPYTTYDLVKGQYLIIGRSTLENTCSGHDKPNGSAQNIKYYAVFLYFQENPKYL